jgi:alpha-L-fucosidase
MKSKLLLLFFALSVLPRVFAADAPVPATAPTPAAAPIVSGGAAYAAVPRNSNGIFIHWGVYSVPAHGEWYMNNGKVPVTTYKAFAKDFTAVKCRFSPLAARTEKNEIKAYP